MSIHTKMHGATHTVYTNYTVDVCVQCTFVQLTPMADGRAHYTCYYGPCAAISIAQLLRDDTYEEILAYIRKYEPNACSDIKYGTCSTTVDSIMLDTGYAYHTSSNNLLLRDMKRTATKDMVVAVQLPNGDYHMTFVDDKGYEHSTMDSREGRVVGWWC